MTRKNKTPKKPRKSSRKSLRSRMDGAHEWSGGIGTLTATMAGQSEVLEAMVWMEGTMIVGTEVVLAGEALLVASESLTKTMHAPAIGKARQPPRMRVSSTDLAAALRADHPDLEVVVGATPVVDEMLRKMAENFEGGQYETSGEDGLKYAVPQLSSEMNADAVASYFEGAAAMFRTQLWKTVPANGGLFAVSIPALGLHEGVLSVDSDGTSGRLMLFPTVSCFMEFLVSSRTPSSSEEPGVTLSFEHKRKVLPETTREIEKHGWDIAGASAYPHWMSIEDEQHITGPAPAQMRRVDAATRGLVKVMSEKTLYEAWATETPQSYDYTVTTHSGPVKITLSVPVNHNSSQMPSADGPDYDVLDVSTSGQSSSIFRKDRPPLERDLLALLALWNTPTSRSQWAKGAAAAGLRVAGRKLSSKALQPFCERFADQGLVWEYEESRSQEIGYRVPDTLTVPCLQDAMARGRLDDLYDVAEQIPYPKNNQTYSFAPPPPFWIATMLRLALLKGDQESALELIEEQREATRGKDKRQQFGQWLTNALSARFPVSWLEALAAKDASTLADGYFGGYRDYMLATSPALMAALPNPAVQSARHAALKGGGDEVLAMMPPKKGAPLRMLSAFCRNDHDAAADQGEVAIADLGKRKYKLLNGSDGVVHMLACLATAATRPASWEHLKVASKDARAAKLEYQGVYDALGLLVREMRGAVEDPLLWELDSLLSYTNFAQAPWYVTLTLTIVHGFLQRPSPYFAELSKNCLELAKRKGLDGIAQELAGAIALLEGKSAPPNTVAARLKKKEPWELGLDSLALIANRKDTTPATTEVVFEEYISWSASLGFNDQRVHLTPRLITSARSTKGKVVSLSRLLDGSVSAVSSADKMVLAKAEKHAGYRPGSFDWSLPSAAIVALVGHPHVVRASGAPLKVVQGQVRLDVFSEGESIKVSLIPQALLRSEFFFEEESTERVVVYELDAELERITDAFNGEPLMVPASESSRLSEVLAGLSSRVRISANADIEIAGDDVAPNPRPVVFLTWDGSLLSATLFAAPLGLEGPHVKIGDGSRVLVTSLEGRTIRTTRSLDEEKRHLSTLSEICPSVQHLDTHETSLEIEHALQLIGELHEAGDRAEVVWPRGKKLAPAKRAGVSNLRVGTTESSKWLELEISVAVDEDAVVSFRDLLASRGRRFIHVGDEQFLAISDELRKRLDAFEGITKVTKSGATASHATLPWIAELAAGGEFELDTKSAARHASFERARRLRARVPRVFRAELRDYQLDGFRWAAQLAEAGLGACLADDMGLGKTIQTLALLCLRRKKGPALVVAPSSVASNWISEAHRFAPSLNVALLADSQDRAHTLQALGTSDVLVCSYGLLQREVEALADVDFDSVVFDEAHLLKNSGTKRSKASKALNANFRLSLTGTPIENHLGELWSLMESTVPGLLGPKKRFEKHYALPIAAGDRPRAQELRALLRPFMLRRTKAQVLDELPPRTEVTLTLTPNKQEAAFYEAVRLRAVERLSSASGDDSGPNRITILAEITRLRQAAVDPRLLDDKAPPGTKVGELMDRVLALRAEGHRVLVFSQFLGALALVRNALDEAEVSYQTLDGSVATAERARRIDAFQNGEGDVFVISLRAGGVGVNLTGADYVIHMDPWWNPAVEEQATARSHRIGQTRPVTMYRMVSKGTIEEKILALHQKKRALAENLLEGIDQAKKLDLAQLRALLS